jgi:hypothetical protein
MAPAHVQNSDRICAPPGIVATRREQLRAQQQRYESETVDLKAEKKGSNGPSSPLTANCAAAATPAPRPQSTSVTPLQTSDGSKCQVCCPVRVNGTNEMDAKPFSAEVLLHRAA